MASFGSDSSFGGPPSGGAPMHQGNDIPGDDIPEGRPRLKLKKRSAAGGAKPRQTGGRSLSSGIFGQARTREEILASKGIDSSALEKRIAAKTQRLPRMSKDEEETYDAIVEEIAFCNSEIEKAETEEEKAKAQGELATKEAQLKAHVDGIRKAIEEKLKAPKEAGRPRFERPSERRRRLEESGRGGGNDLGASFSNSRGGGGGGYNSGGFGGGGGGGGRGGSRPGDWNCAECGANVFASKSSCFKCGAGKPEGAGGDFGGGGGGGYSNGGGRGGYGGGGGYDNGGYGGGGGGGQSRPGDWECPSCGANVFASKSACFKCNTPKPGGGDGGFDQGGYGGGGY
jgi:phosphopantetheinyl transferase (holo-ACP synthase)